MWGRPLILLCVVIAVQSGPSADFSPCKENDKGCQVNNGKIIFNKIVEGIPSLNIVSLDPMFHEEIEADLGALKYKLSKSTVTGLKDCVLNDLNISLEKKTIHMDFDCPRFDMFGIYEIAGSLLTLPIQGKGDYKMKCTDYHIVIDSDVSITENDGRKYISLKNHKFSGQLQGGGVDMKNLFNGQKELADTVLKTLNENWVALSNDFQGPVFKANVKQVVKNFNKYFKTTPIDSFIV